MRKIVAIVQARMGSTRFPGKVMRPICGTPMIGLLLARLKRAQRIDMIIVATSYDERNEPLVRYVHNLGYEVFQGAEDDVLDRYYQAAKWSEAGFVVRITGDCPLIDPAIVDLVVTRLLKSGADYASNTMPPTYPDGLDVEAFTVSALETAWRTARMASHREHVTLFMRESEQFTRVNVTNEVDCSAMRWTVDEPEDCVVVERIFDHFSPRIDFSWKEVIALHEDHPDWFLANRHLKRNEGAELGTGQKLWKRAKRIIPGGSMLLSKRAEMFLPDQWPAYFSKAKGCRVWDLDGHEYIDMSLMGVGTNVLGYGHPEVDGAVSRAIAGCNMTTLNCPEEVYLAERLLELHPWAEMVRFTRTGGEACAVAIRIARAASGRDQVAFCGYHGWHDWYLAANLGDKDNLSDHLLPGLDPLGVPTALKGTAFPFRYNQFSELVRLVQEQRIGVIMMEVSRNIPPEDGFLERVRELARRNGIVLIFDECTSGFRQTFGGLHKLYGVEPDMAVFSKALGNGYAISAVIGRRSVMEAGQKTFISSTFWTERIGPAAALKTLEVMERVKSWEQITQTGLNILEGWRALAQKYGLRLRTSGLPALASFTFDSPKALAYKTLLAQEMLARGYLASTSVYTCIEHSSEIVGGYLVALDPVFGLIKECEEGRDVKTLLKGPVCHTGFQRLN